MVVAALSRRDPISTGMFMRTHVLSAKQRLIATVEAQYADHADVENSAPALTPKRRGRNGPHRKITA